ncbi:MAG: hypothetical protein FH756_01665 [Firmicutes bacterium]|nr:hypothetical protein [Bacillota bacterium]
MDKLNKIMVGEPRQDGEENANGEVREYRMSPEEVARRYGPPVKTSKRRRPKLNRELLAEQLKTRTVGQISERYQVPQEIVFKLAEKFGLELDDKNRLAGGEDVARGDKIRAARETLPPDEFEEMVRQGLTDQEVANTKGLNLYTIKQLKREYGLVGITGRGRNHHVVRKEREGMNGESINQAEAKEQAQEEQVQTQEPETKEEYQAQPAAAGKKISVLSAVRLLDELTNEMSCTEDILKPDAELAPRVRKLLEEHFSECSVERERIQNALGSVEIEV